MIRVVYAAKAALCPEPPPLQPPHLERVLTPTKSEGLRACEVVCVLENRYRIRLCGWGHSRRGRVCELDSDGIMSADVNTFHASDIVQLGFVVSVTDIFRQGLAVGVAAAIAHSWTVTVFSAVTVAKGGGVSSDPPGSSFGARK
jgi:hypothetical protein